MSGRRNKGGGGHGDGGEERWLLPYADMITLLLGLFIVLFAMSTLDAKKFDNLRDSLSQTFDGGQVQTGQPQVLDGSSAPLLSSTTDAPASAPTRRQQSIRSAAKAQKERQVKELTQVAKAAGISGKDVKVTTTTRGVVVSLAGDALFEPGSWQIKPPFTRKLTQLERKLQALGQPIEVAGHTDGQPFNGSRTGNWQLSANRAFAVIDFFIGKGFDENLIEAAFHADTRPLFDPPKGNPTREMPENRRIEITILADDGGATIADALKTPGSAAAASAPAGSIADPVGLDLYGELAATAKVAQ